MKRNNKRRRIGAGILAVCLAAALLLSNQSFGVFAKEDGSQNEAQEDVTSATEENGQEAENQDGSDVAENDTEDASDESIQLTDETGDLAEESLGEAKIADSNAETDTQSVDDAIAIQSDESGVSELIDIDIALLRWKAVGGTVNVTLDGRNYSVTDAESYQEVYTKVYAEMMDKATSITGDLSAQTITEDTIWNISDTVTMTGEINVGTNRLVLIGTGTLTRNGDYKIISNGIVCLQGDVTADGCGDTYDQRFLVMQGTVDKNAELYLSDDFKIQNYSVTNQNGAGIYGSYVKFYMSGGTIGSKEISFTWDDGKTTSYGTETTTYLGTRERNGEYPYLKKVNSSKGCKGRDLTGSNAPHGGGFALENSAFYMSDGNIVGNVLSGECTTLSGWAGSHGAGADFKNCNVYITGGKISGNQSSVTGNASSNYRQYSGAIQLEVASGGTYVCEISNTEVSYNYSQMWVGAIDIYAGNTLHLKEGAVFKYNHSNSNSGAIAVDGTGSKMIMEDGAQIIRNHAGGLGGGIRCLGTLTMNGGEIAYNSSQNDAAGLSIQTDENRTGTAYLYGGTIHDNYSTRNGGGIGMVTGIQNKRSGLTLSGTKVYNNKAAGNGGGIYIDANHGFVSAVLEKGELLNNVATNGGGIYVNQYAECEASVDITSDNLKISKNHAAKAGGGIYLYHDSDSTGNISANVIGGFIEQNSSGTDGGGIYINNGNLMISGGSIDHNTANANGGGAYVAEGKVRMFGGNMVNNHANGDGGGVYVSSKKLAADVVVRSGSITNNTSGGSGGGIAVAGGESAKADTVILGLLEQHKDLKIMDAGRSFTPFPYTDDKDSKEHTHTSCPVLSNNTATGEGGGIYMQSSAASLNIYCLEESGNISKKDANGNGVMMAGGKLVIGDEAHNDSAAWGNTVISSPMLVEGGNVDIWGSMNNPLFNDNILVDIKKGAGKFEDHRVQAADQVTRYKIHYFENFTAGGTQEATGMYIANQYKEKDTIDASGTLFTHEGWKIVGWATKADKDAGRITYQIGSNIGKDGDHKAWGNSASEPLVLYAIWERTTYTVIYHPNADSFAGEDTMKSQSFSYGETQSLRENGYKVVGKRFVCWNTKPDGTGIRYEKDYKESKMTATNRATIDLYAQWVDCTHNGGAHPGKLSYTVNAKDHSITETCDCENHTAIITLTGRDAYHDGKPHPAEMSGELLAANPDITYKFSKTKDGTYTDMKNGEKPTEIGFYQASITVEDKTVTVSYEIKSAGANVVVDAECIEGQRLGAFSGTKICNAAGDDAFTVWYSIQNLNRTYYSEAPQLVLSQQLPEGTTIIMYANGSYWYTNAPTGKDTIALDTFTKMGGTEKFNYSFAEAQEYRFVFDFSKVTGTALSGTLNVKLVYKHNTASSDPVSGVVDISFGAKGAFALSGTAESLQITAPESVRFGRWENKNQVLVVSEADGTAFPADARLVVKVGDKTYTYRKNVRNVFVVPISWNSSQTVSMSLDSDMLVSKKTNYAANIALCVGDNVKKLNSQPQAAEYATAAQCTVTLNVTDDVSPSLRIDGTQKVLEKTEKLNLTVTMENTSGYTIHATIQQKETKTENETKAADEMKTSYGGNFLDADVQEGANSFSLGGIKEAGSYRLLITVTKDKQELLAVPYYFIVQ